MTGTGLSWWGRAGLTLLVVHITVLFFPPIPPLTKCSLWSYLAGYATVILFLLELRQQQGRLIAVWAARNAAQRLMFGLGATAWTLIAAAFVLAVAALYWTGYLQPRALVDLMTSIDFLWVVLGLGFLFAASSVEAHLFGLRTSGPTLEESLELSGAICFASYAVQIASRVGRERNSAQRADDGLDPA